MKTRFSFFTGIAFLSSAFPLLAALEIANPGERPVKPLRELHYTAKEVDEIRVFAKNNPRFRSIVDAWFKTASVWLDLSEEEIDRLMPPQDAIFADGATSGDPKTDKKWPRWGAEMCSLDRPFEVRSPDTGDVYGLGKKGEPFYDPRDGWVRPSDGKRFYFVGIWNSYVMMHLLNSVSAMGMSYMLTGDEAIAQRLLYLMDKMATMRARRPNVDGPVDWPYPRRVNEGFFCLMGNQANTRIYMLSLVLDMVGRSPYAQHDSWSNPGKSVFANIRDHLIQVIEPESMKDLQNHGVSAYSAFLAKALVFGEPENIRHGIEATYAFLDNCIDRDGEYYEVSGDYGNLGYAYGGRLIEMLSNYRPENYDEPGRFPQRAEYPFALDFASDPRWYSLAVKSQFRLSVLGRGLSYGDSAPDRRSSTAWATKDLNRMRDYLLFFHGKATNPEWKKETAELYWSLPGYVRERPSMLLSSSSLWKEPEQPAEKGLLTVKPENSILLGGKGTALLRSGSGESARALFMRGGHAESHANDDQLALSLYANGMNVTGEFGYSYYGTPEHLGFGTRPVAHQTVVVDEGLPAVNSLWRNLPSADITAYVSEAPAQVVEMAHPVQWAQAGVSDYRRQSWLIDIDAENFYVLDLFRIKGGKRHDYLWNAPYLTPAREDDGFTLEGINPRAEKGAWTLAAMWNPELRNEEYNAPGKSWGERILGGSGRIKDVKKESSRIGYWNPAPGNGYGFIYDVKSAKTKETWSALWELHDGKSTMKLTMLNPDQDQTVVSGRSGTLQIETRHALVAARRRDENGNLASRFLSIAQVKKTNGEWPVASFEPLKVVSSNDEKNATASVAHLQTGERDLLLTGDHSNAEVVTEEVRLLGEKGFVRLSKEGEPKVMLLSGGTLLAAKGVMVQVAEATQEAEVLRVEAGLATSRVEVAGNFASGEALAGVAAFIGSSKEAKVSYSHNEYYPIARIERGAEGTSILDFSSEHSLNLSHLIVQEVQPDGTVLLKWPNMSAGRAGMKSFTGHELVVAGDPTRSVTLLDFPERRKILVDEPSGLKAGDRLEVRAVRKGDRVRVPAFVQVRATAEKEWVVRLNQKTTVTLPTQAGESLLLVVQGEAKGKGVGAAGSASIVIDPVALEAGQIILRLEKESF